ncbi:YhdT family protein [Piscibacillus halophilus]|uniref:Uncharacterized membrane protein YhdT n=1 Tax=Piscibacillus halophilus TaxID=571933 RepID=A0A1H9EBF1_9BACI|nr:YhdT family protein [Piscibacillus halophilus]SEQ23051.1 Uncharacterized membrane protein YhdT [Piscibacillus halophilus]
MNKDWRFRISHREALMGVVLALINFLWWYGFAYGLGQKAPEDYTYIFGFPAWFFWSCIIGFLVMVSLVILTVKFLLTDLPLDDREEEHSE